MLSYSCTPLQTMKEGIIMLKFQNNNATVIETFEDFILTAYVMIDELYHRFAPPKVTNKHHISDTRQSDPEIIPITICGEPSALIPKMHNSPL